MAVANGAGTCSASQMQSNDVDIFGIFAEKFRHGSRDEGVANAVEAVFSQMVLLGDFLVDGIGPNVFRNR